MTRSPTPARSAPRTRSSPECSAGDGARRAHRPRSGSFAGKIVRVDQIPVDVEGGLRRVVVGHEPELVKEPGAGGAGVAQRVVDVAGDVEGLGVAGDHVDDGGEDVGLAAGWPAGPSRPAVLGDYQGQVAEACRSQPVASRSAWTAPSRLAGAIGRN